MGEKFAKLLVYLILFIIVAGTVFFVVFVTFQDKYQGTMASLDTGKKKYSEVLENKDIYFMFIDSVLDHPSGPSLVIIYKDGSVARGRTTYEVSLEESQNLVGQQVEILYATLNEDLVLKKDDFKFLKEEIDKLKLKSRISEYSYFSTDDKYYIGYVLRNEDDSLSQVKITYTLDNKKTNKAPDELVNFQKTFLSIVNQ